MLVGIFICDDFFLELVDLYFGDTIAWVDKETPYYKKYVTSLLFSNLSYVTSEIMYLIPS